MKIYIQSAAAISPHQTRDTGKLPADAPEHEANMLSVVEPDYGGIIDAKVSRRMSRIIRMGVAAAIKCVREAGQPHLDGIVMGTGYGCMEDTDLFLGRLLEQNEEMLSPTSFIQSTHNTVGAQIALLMNCHAYNTTFVHRGFSFESALLDAKMLLQENPAANILAGSADEITEVSHFALKRLGMYKRVATAPGELFESDTRGTIAGEGTAFFLLSASPSDGCAAVLRDMHTFYGPANTADVEARIGRFLQANSHTITDIDLVITGRNGDATHDRVYETLAHGLLKNCASINYKQLCGEYPTSSSFALWLATSIVSTDPEPGAPGYRQWERRPGCILIYNSYLNEYHSLMLVSKP